MNRRIISILLALAVYIGAFAQQNQGEVIPSTKTRRGLKEKQVGTTIMHVDYAMNADSIGQEQTYIDKQRLEVGRDCAKYSSLFLRRFVGSTRPTQNGQAILRGGKPGKNNAYWNDIQFADLFFKDGQVTEYVSMPMYHESNDCQFTEPCPPQQWTLTPGEESVICGYRCQRATCRWRGRDYVAWFAPDIPVKRGPWRFNGLPGLILKLYDTNRFYTFEAVGLKKVNGPMMLYDFPYSKSTRQRVRNLQRTLQVNYWKATAQTTQFPNKPFEQLEKE
ncbi:MAG: GLPGLI family protein [Bacteroidaceae bacterium]|nr:GLPGLI family protein [Bacteroidaceae bacterium]